MKFEDILTTKYSAEFAKGLFAMANFNDGNGVVITEWSIPNVPQPTHDEVMAMQSEVQEQYDNQQMIITFAPYIENIINLTAAQRKYNSPLSLISYATSTNPNWSADATVFIAWRDAMWGYAIDTYNNVIAGVLPRPTVEQFMAGAPKITWSN